MRKTLCLVLLVGVATAAGAAGDLDGKRIVLVAGDRISLHPPVALPCDTVIGENQRVTVRQNGTGKDFPVTVRDGEFVFVPEGAMPKKKHSYEVRVKEDDSPYKVQLTKVDGKDAITVTVEGKKFTGYWYSNDDYKPYLWPVYSQGGTTVTRDYPMGEKELTADHPHHRSMYTAYGDLNGADCWSQSADKAGYQRTDDIQFGSGDAYGWISAKNTWLDHDKKPVISEAREYRFYASPDNQRMFDATVTFTADYGDALFADTKEGGIMALRIRDIMNEKAGNGGIMTNAEGLTGEKNIWGKPSPWCDYSSPVLDKGVHGVAIFDHPTNLRHPTCWHARGYGLMTANCFGLKYFTKGKENGDYTLKAGESVTFNYRVLVHTGDVAKAKVGDRYADYATPPKVKWAKK
jgi:methane monooxygenase PmoA-like